MPKLFTKIAGLKLVLGGEEFPDKSTVLASVFLLLSLASISKEALAVTFDYVPKPEFVDSGSELNVTSYLSQTSRLPCRVRHLGSKKVSWIRGKDLQVISSGRTKFITDIRVSILPGSSSKRFDKRSLKEDSLISYVPVDDDNDANEGLNSSDRFYDKVETLNKMKKSRKKRNGNHRKRYWEDKLSSGLSYPGQEILHSDPYAFIDTNFDLSKRELLEYYSQDDYDIYERREDKKKRNDHPFNKMNYEYLNDNYDARYQRHINNTSTQDGYSSIPMSPTPSSSASILSSHSSLSYYDTPSSGIKTYYKKHSRKHPYREQNDILNGNVLEQEGRRKEPQEEDLKNPIFIRPLGDSNNFKGNLASKRLQVPYNYLDAFWEPEDFTLQIKYTKRSDAGTYLCQINTEPRVTQIVHLRVVEMIALIDGAKELYVKEGSPVTLICKITHGDNLPGFIFWYKNDLLVDYDSTKGRVEVDMSMKGQTQLILKEVVGEDSANYTCSPSGGMSDSVMLTVIADKRPEAVQQSNAAAFADVTPQLIFLLPTLFYWSCNSLAVVS